MNDKKLALQEAEIRRDLIVVQKKLADVKHQRTILAIDNEISNKYKALEEDSAGVEAEYPEFNSLWREDTDGSLCYKIPEYGGGYKTLAKVIDRGEGEFTVKFPSSKTETLFYSRNVAMRWAEKQCQLNMKVKNPNNNYDTVDVEGVRVLRARSNEDLDGLANVSPHSFSEKYGLKGKVR